MWMMATKGTATGIYLYRSLAAKTIKDIVEADVYNLFWVNLGAGATSLLAARNGEKVNCATLITPRILKQYLKE